MNEIVRNVYIGSIFDVKKYLEEEWDEKPIAILSIGDFKNPGWRKYGKNISHVYYDGIDDYDAPGFAKILDQAITFISKNYKTKKVLVHCWAGVNRSVSTVIAWLALEKGLTVERARSMVEAKRTRAHPFDGLIKVIRDKKANKS